MSRDISEIPGLSGKTLVLFRAAGFVNVESLLGKSTQEIDRVLSATNDEFGIVGWLPSTKAVRAWIATARILEEAESGETGPLTAEESAQVHESAVMVARPVLGAELQEAGVSVDAVPIARFVGDLPKSPLVGSAVAHLRAGGRKRRARNGPREEEHTEPPARPAESDDEVLADEAEEKQFGGMTYQEAIMPGERSSVPEEEREPHRESEPEPGENATPAPPPRRRREVEPTEQPDLVFRDTESLSALSKGSERRNSGMTHKSPGRAVASALATVVTLTLSWITALTVIGSGVYFALTSGQMPVWLLWLLPVIPVCLLIYATVGLRARCRLCGYRLFAHKTCLKHEKAHRSIVGSIFPTALRLLIRGTWRCMYCGTKQKLK